MNFMRRDGWSVTFLEADCKTSVGRRVAFTDPDRIIELAKRGGVTLDLSTRQAIEHGISMGRGSVWLFLTSDQYHRLQSR